jgi:hypothetical protein
MTGFKSIYGLGRRAFLAKVRAVFGALALASMGAKKVSVAPNFIPKAKALIQILCSGGLSHVDACDYKPDLDKRAGKPFEPDGKLQFFASKPGNCRPSFLEFKQHPRILISQGLPLPRIRGRRNQLPQNSPDGVAWLAG